MRSKALFFFIAAPVIAGSANAQNKITWTSQGPPPLAASDSSSRHSGGDGNYDSNGYWCAPAPPLEITTEPASASSFAYGPTSGVLSNSGRGGSFSDYLNAPSSSAAANFATASASPSLGEIAPNLRQSKMQGNRGPMIIRQDNSGRLQVCDATGGNCKAPR
jgi:hypothetical protein